MKEEMRRRRAADRISRLPDDVLCRILSFVPTKQAVATCILSKRWTHLWLSLPSIEFNNIFIFSIKTNSRFNKYMKSILISRDNAGTPFNRFSLDIGYASPHFAYKLSFPEVVKWINFVAKRKLENLRLDLNLDDFDDCDNEYDVNERFLFKLPKRILNCRTLVSLDLSHFTVPRYSFSSTEFGFPSLKKLCLSDVDFDGDFALFLSGCPILEDLQLFQLYLSCDEDSYTQFKSLSLSKLTRADITDCMCYSFSLNALSTSESLCLDTFRTHTQERQVYEKVYQEVAHPLRPFDDIPIFHNLTYLELNHTVHLVVQVLHHCPKLKNFKYEGLYASNEEDDQKNWVDPESVPQCLLSHLRTCTIGYRSGLQSQLMLAKYILKNANVLQTMKISSESEKSKLSECPKASATCQLL